MTDSLAEERWEDIRWSNPLAFLSDKIILKDKSVEGSCESLYSRYDDYFVHLQYLEIIWNRLITDHNIFRRCYKTQKGFYNKVRKLQEQRPNITLDYRLTEQELKEQSQYDRSYKTVKLDYDSFIIFAKILMDKMAKIAVCLIIKSPKAKSPTNDADIRMSLLVNIRSFFLNKKIVLLC